VKNHKIALHWQIILGMIAGIGFGVLMIQFSWGPEFVKDWIRPLGTIFINALKLIAVPLILASLIKGVSDLKDVSQLSKMGTTSIISFLSTTVISVCIGLVLVNLIKPGNQISDSTRMSLVNNFEKNIEQKLEQARSVEDLGPLQSLIEIVPDNIFLATTDNSKMLQVIFFAIFFGIGLVLSPKEKVTGLKNFFDGMNEVILKMIDFIMLIAPLGVFALLAALVVESPNPDIFSALALYVLTVLVGLFSMLLIYATIIKIIAKRPVADFFKSLGPAQLVAFSTSSSAATLPVTMEQVEEKLKIPKEVTSFVLPLGATVNMDGTSLYQAVAAVFIAQAFGIELSFMAQLGIIVTATLASIGSAAVPGAGMVMLVIVLGQAGIPESGLALIFAVDRPLDMCRTVINVTGDAMVCLLVHRFSQSKKRKIILNTKNVISPSQTPHYPKLLKDAK